MPLASRVLVPSALLLGACPGPGADSNASLADLPGLRVSVQTSGSSDDKPTAGSVSVTYDVPAFVAAHGDCATLGDDLGGELDGTDLDPSSLGTDDDGFGDCYYPLLPFEVRFADDRASVLTIFDESLTVRAEYPASAFEAHHPILLEPGDWRFRGGQQVRVGWSHPADLPDAPLQYTDVTFHIGDRGRRNANGDNAFPLSPQLDGQEIHFTVPSPPPITGPGYIGFEMGYSAGTATTCTGAAACEYGASRSYAHTVEIER